MAGKGFKRYANSSELECASDDSAVKAEDILSYNAADDQLIHEDTFSIRLEVCKHEEESPNRQMSTKSVANQNKTVTSKSQEQNKDNENIQKVLLKINQIIQNQKQIMAKLTSLSTQMDDAFSKINRLEMTKESTPESTIQKQIKQVEDLEEFEQLISNVDYRKELIKSYSVVCSGGRGSATNCAYRFLDILFAREFLCECSWSGASRGEGVKISLKCYRNTLKFFFEMIQYWDPTYTVEANELFIKSILRNAKKRTSATLQRIPTKRCRPKKGKRTKTQNNVETDEVATVTIKEDDLSDEKEGFLL